MTRLLAIALVLAEINFRCVPTTGCEDDDEQRCVETTEGETEDEGETEAMPDLGG